MIILILILSDISNSIVKLILILSGISTSIVILKVILSAIYYYSNMNTGII